MGTSRRTGVHRRKLNDHEDAAFSKRAARGAHGKLQIAVCLLINRAYHRDFAAHSRSKQLEKPQKLLSGLVVCCDALAVSLARKLSNRILAICCLIPREQHGRRRSVCIVELMTKRQFASSLTSYSDSLTSRRRGEQRTPVLLSSFTRSAVFSRRGKLGRVSPYPCISRRPNRGPLSLSRGTFREVFHDTIVGRRGGNGETGGDGGR